MPIVFITVSYIEIYILLTHTVTRNLVTPQIFMDNNDVYATYVIARPSYLSHGNPDTWNCLYIERGS